MREILFRGKRVDNGEWIIGYHLVVDGISYILPEGDFLNGIIQVDPATVGQYTGLLDKNSVKIFEGDRVIVPMYKMYTAGPNFMKGTIEWKNGAFHVTWDDEMYGRHFVGYLEGVEVIGNIFDNLEPKEENNG